MILFIDTETTGLIDFRAPLDARHQPMMCQLAGVLCQEDGIERGRFSAIIQRPGPIPAEATAVHGLTNDICTRAGIGLEEALAMLRVYARVADTIVSYNWEFDSQIIQIQCCRRKLPLPWRHDIDTRCAMKMAADHCPERDHAGRSKWPKLATALRYLTGIDLQLAHDAMADVVACSQVYFQCVELERRNAGKTGDVVGSVPANGVQP